MSFGFSIGDFIAVGKLAINTYALLQDSTGSSADYQSLKLMRKSFGETVASVETELQSANSNPLPKSLVNAAKIHLSECSQLLQNFDEIAKKYDACLSPRGSGRKAIDTWRKLKWGGVKDDTRELFRRLQTHIEAVEMLFNFNNLLVMAGAPSARANRFVLHVQADTTPDGQENGRDLRRLAKHATGKSPKKS